MTSRYDPERRHRRSIRLKGYDYSQSAAYFVTIVAQNRLCLFGEVTDGVMQLNSAGRMIATEWRGLPARFPSVQLYTFVIMPNHFHGILVIAPVGAPLVGAQDNVHVGAPLVGAQDNVHVGAPLVGAQGNVDAPATPTTGATTRVAPTIGDVVGAFKSLTTVDYTRGVRNAGWQSFTGRLWQRNYYEHIIRDGADLDRIRQYITDNPTRWIDDPENPGAVPVQAAPDVPVGAPLVGVQDNVHVGAPLVGVQDNVHVGAPLVGAQGNVGVPDDVGTHSTPAPWATTKVAPTNAKPGKPR